jgi:hypothetical protein
MSNKAELNFILCGGAGINIGKLLRTSKLNDRVAEASYLALDASGNNPIPKELNIPLERVAVSGDASTLANGSGKVRATNYEAAQPFVNDALTKHTPGTFNVVVFSGSGGSGSILGTLVIRWLKQNGYKFIAIIINDHTSTIEMENAVKTMTGLAVQTQPNFLNAAIPHIEFKNTPDKTRGEIDRAVVNRITTLSLFATGKNEEQDLQDVLNVLDYSNAYKVPAALSRISFFDNPDNYKGPAPVAVVSLFSSSSDIKACFEGTHIRSTGVFAPGTILPEGVTQMHMILDHGEGHKKLESESEDLEKRSVTTRTTYVAQKDMSKGADTNGIPL